HEPRADLLVDDRGNSEPRLLDEMTLDRIREPRRAFGVQRARAGDARDLPETVAHQLGAARGELALPGELKDPRAPELRSLLFPRHPPEEIVDALVARPVGVAIRRLDALEDRQRGPSSARHEPRTTRRVGSSVCSGTGSAPSMRRMRIFVASKPICLIGCSIV